MHWFRKTAVNSGPSHTIDSTQTTLFLGNSVDGDNGMLQNGAANADDADGARPDDEDGVLNPLDLHGTIGAAPTITLLVTNTTGSQATLSGWIDYNQNGVFDNTTERTQIAVPNGSTDERFTLTFPAIPSNSTGTTYARFRLSTDAEAENSTGEATDGEVEDYPFTIIAPSSGPAASVLKIASETNGGPLLTDNDIFGGGGVAALGDLDGDGIDDIAVGAYGDDTGGPDRGAVHVLFMNTDGSVKSSSRIAHSLNGGPTLADSDRFGRSVANVGDLNGDGIQDIAVGTDRDDSGGFNRGAVYVLLLNSDGTVKSSTKIANNLNGGPTLADFDYFGRAVAGVGDLDGDGINDLAVGAVGDDEGGSARGAVHVLFLDSDGSARSSARIAHNLAGGPSLNDYDGFGESLASAGDLNGDGINDMVAGAVGDDTGGLLRGAVHVLFLDTDGSVKSSSKIAHAANGGPDLVDRDFFGRSVTETGDLNGDGIPDLAVGANGDDTSGSLRGAVHVLFMNGNGTVDRSVKIADGFSGGPTLTDSDQFGSSVSVVGDLDGDGIPELVVGARGDDTGGNFWGALWVLNLLGVLTDFGDAPDTGAGTGAGNYETTLADDGPSHSSDLTRTTLFLGNSVDGDDGTLQNVTANADDIAGIHPDDEDGVLNPLDLHGTIGSAPTVTLLVTNTTGSAATLSGWIDYNNDGVFDNATERAQATIADGTTDGRFTLTFPVIPDGFTGTTYARFRLSTDAAAANSTGAALDGEVEDYQFAITTPSGGVAKSFTKIASELNGGPVLGNGDQFGSSVTSLGDLDGDGVVDLAVGAYRDGIQRGAVHVLMMNANGTVKSSTKIASDTNGGPTLSNFDNFGSSVTSLGDLDGDGLADLAVGAERDDTGGSGRGAVYVLLLDADGTVKSSTKIASGTGGGPVLANSDNFGSSVTGVGDLDGDGVADLAVGADGDDGNDTGGVNRGAVHVLLLNANGTVKSSTKIASGLNGGPVLANADNFGSSVTDVGDLDGDGVADLAVGAERDDTGGDGRGAVYILNFAPPQAESTTLPSGGGNYELLLEGDDLVLRVAGGGELLRQSTFSVSELTITGSSSDDIVTLQNTGGAVSTPILFTGQGGADQFDGSLATGSTTLLGGAGNDTLTGGTVDDFISGGSGKDVVAGGAGNDRLDGRSGPDTLTGGAGNDTIRGGQGRDFLVGSQEADTLLGGGGRDTISGREGNDRIFGGGGRDLLDGDAGDDTLLGGAGADDLAGGLGNDTLNGVFRDDSFNLVVGPDTLIGGQRPSGRPASPVALISDAAADSQRSHTPPALTNDEASDGQGSGPENGTDDFQGLDEAFADSLIPELLEL